VGHIELLQTDGVSNGIGQGTKKLVKADVEHREVLQQAYLGGQAGAECVVHENDLVEV